MTDERPDARDGWLAERLRVEPLDEVTRRRLVGTALRAAGSRDGGVPAAVHGRGRRRPLAAAAAALAVVLVGGLAFLAVRGDGSGSSATSALKQPAGETASGPAAADAPGDAAQAAPSPSGRATTATPELAPGGVTSLGELGDLRAPAARARLHAAVAALDNELAVDGFAGASTVDAGALVQQLVTAGCADDLPRGTVVAVGTGRLGSRDAIAAVVAVDGGSRAAYAVVVDGCAVHPLP